MSQPTTIFKAYDIRGVHDKTLTEEIAREIGRAFITVTKAKKVVVGRDIRTHSKAMFDALVGGITAQGSDVIDIGECSTPMTYFANGTLGADASIMITASHNPAEWNGFKLCRAKAEPISGVTGIKDIEAVIENSSYDPLAATPGTVSSYDIIPEYTKHVAQFAHLQHPLHVAIDFANNMGIWEARTLESLITWHGLYDNPDGTFPNHEANPLDVKTLVDLQAEVRKGGYAFGIAFDGDADRVGFVDEKGEVIPMDLITALIAQDILATRKAVILYDLRSSWVVKETIAAAGGTPMMCRVGHAFIKAQMREHDAVFAGEMSGHYYFKDNFTAESDALAIISVANIVSRSDKPLSELVAPLRKYFKTDELNTEVTCDPDVILNEIRQKYADGHQFELDGISVEYADWWFNVRRSNTENLVRLNLEAKTKELMDAKTKEVLDIIKNYAVPTDNTDKHK